ncbi:MAG: hypothetical protein ACYDAJ_01685 [Nitrosotalea sp.]
MKFHSGTHSGTTVSGLETVNFLVIEKRGNRNQVDQNTKIKITRSSKRLVTA